jgi:Cu-Zn family superoxide dismutase
MKHANRWKLAGAGALLAGFALSAGAQPSVIAHTQLKDRQGQFVGYADLMETAGGLLIRLMVKDFEPGQHAVHIHAMGKCEPPFESAGPHFNPANRNHGLLMGEGHAGDLPNIHVPDSGMLEVEMVTTRATLQPGRPDSLLDRDGSSLVIHAGSDDYRTNPDGDSGERIACGVISSESTVGGSTGK